MPESSKGGNTNRGGGNGVKHERKGYPAPPAKTTDLPKAPKGPAPGSGETNPGKSDK